MKPSRQVEPGQIEISFSTSFTSGNLRGWRRELRAKYKELKSLPKSPEVAKERATVAELIRECESKLLIEKATQWGIDTPTDSDSYAQETNANLRIITPYLNQAAKAVLIHKIRSARFAYWKAWSEILIPILSLIVAILALIRVRG
jgi:hypothetical protein